MHLRLALSRLPVSRMQSKIAAHIAALAETMPIFQCEQERQCDQRAYALDLLQQIYLRIDAGRSASLPEEPRRGLLSGAATGTAKLGPE